MKIPVHMFAFNKDKGIIRDVDVPDNEYGATKNVWEKLELVFRYGQNEFQKRNTYSVSVGDVVEIDNKYFMVMSTGFEELSKAEFDSLQVPTSTHAYKKTFNLGKNK